MEDTRHTIVEKLSPVGTRSFTLHTESGGVYHLTIHDDCGRYSAILRGASSSSGRDIQSEGSNAKIDGRDLFTVPPSGWLSRVIRVGRITTSPVVRIIDATTGEVLEASPKSGPASVSAEAFSSGIEAQINKLRLENERLRGGTLIKVSPKGAISVYGLGRFPITLYVEQWHRLLVLDEEIRKFIQTNAAALKKR